MKKLFKDRLLKLAAHLQKGKLGHDRFDFETWHQVNCTSAGCAIGECPTIWPRAFRFSRVVYCFLDDVRKGNVILTGTRKQNEEAAMKWFDLNSAEVVHLFVPTTSDNWRMQKPELYGGRILGPKAKPAQVAANILAFVAKKEQLEK